MSDSPASILYDSGGTEKGTDTNPVRTDPTGETAQPITDGGGSVTVDGSVAVTNFPAVQPVSDNGGSLTVDGTVTANAGTGPWPVTDNGGSLTTDTPQLPAALVGARLDINNGAWLGSTSPTVGQKTMTASLPVAIASNQSAVPISAASLPLPTGAATAALQTQPGVDIGDVTVNNAAGAAAVNIQDGGNSITVDGPLTDTQLRATAVPVSAASLPLPAGAATSALQASGNASLTSIDGKTPPLGQAAMAASTPVVLASDHSPITAKEIRAGTSAISSVTASVSVQTLLAANANRLGATIYNGGSKDLWVKFGTGASASSYTVKMVKDAYYEVPYGYTGIITGIWDTSPSGEALMTEMT